MAPVVATTSTILCFNEHRLTQVHLEKAVKMERERDKSFQPITSTGNDNQIRMPRDKHSRTKIC